MHVLKLHWLRLKQLLIGVLALVAVSLFWSEWQRAREVQALPAELRLLLPFPEGYTLPEAARNPRQLDDLAARVARLNRDAELFNWRRGGSVHAHTVVFLIQVHKDVERLQYLIVALGQVQNIKRALLVFSHSYYDDSINRLVRGIRFAKVVQIFFPHSIQLNPDKFPGTDSQDCNDSLACTGRDARRAEHKHHWWWKAHYVFNGFDWSESHKGMVIFLEEDDYVFPDILHTLKFARKALSYFSSAHLISFGALSTERDDYNLFTVDTWRPLFDRGLTFNRSTWLKIAELGSHFCFYDDASWSYSLVHLLEKFPRGYAEMVATVAPRVLATGEFASGRAGYAWGAAKARAARLFPSTLRAVVLFSTAGRARRRWRPLARGNGGWVDLRDHLLCLDPLLATTTETVTGTTYIFEQNNIKNATSSEYDINAKKGPLGTLTQAPYLRLIQNPSYNVNEIKKY